MGPRDKPEGDGFRYDQSTDHGSRLALRRGLRQIDGFRPAWAVALQAGRDRPYTSLEDLMRRGGLTVPALRKLADADAFRSLGLDRREGLWAVRRLPDDDPLPLFAAARARELGEEADASLPTMPLGEHVAADYQMTRLSLKAHPMALLRPVFAREGVLACRDVGGRPDGRFAKTAGLVLVRQRPGKGNAVFITLEDETGVANVVLWARQFERFRREVMASRLMLVEGRVQKSPEGVVHLMATRIVERTGELERLWADPRADPAPRPAGADAAAAPPQARHPRDVRLLPKSRDFH